MFLTSRRERLLLRRDGTLRWTRYWGTSHELTQEQVKASVLRGHRYYLGGDRGLYWPVPTDSMRWLDSNIALWLKNPREAEINPAGKDEFLPGVTHRQVAVFVACYVLDSIAGPLLADFDFYGPVPANEDRWRQMPGWLFLFSVVLAFLLARKQVMDWWLARRQGQNLKPFFLLGWLCNVVILLMISDPLAKMALTLNANEDRSVKPFDLPVISSFHPSTSKDDESTQDLYILELNLPTSIHRAPVTCSYDPPKLRRGDVIHGKSGSGRLGVPWYQIQNPIREDLVNTGRAAYSCGLEQESFGQLTLKNAMRAGTVRAKGSFAPHSRCRAYLKSYGVPIDEVKSRPPRPSPLRPGQGRG